MYVRLNLATKPLISERPFYAGSALIGLVAGLLFLILGVRYYSMRKADAAMRQDTAKVQAEIARVSAQKLELEQFFAKQQGAGLQERAKFTRSMIEARSFNWTQMFMDLERTLPPGVHVLRIEPKLEKGALNVRFTVGATSEEAKFKMLKAFEDSKLFSHVELLGERAESQPGTDPLTVQFTAVYSTI